jgi:hypothetical protein
MPCGFSTRRSVDVGVWLQLYPCGLALTVVDTLHTAAGARTLSGQKTSSYTAFLYARKIIFREEVPAGRKGSQAKKRAQELPETDPDSGSEADTESDGEEHPSPKRRKRKAGSTSDNKKPMELVRCCHCQKTWGPYHSSYTTTSAFKRHIQAKHRKIPFNELSEKAMIEELRARVAAETGTATQGSTPWTKAAQGALGRQPGQRFTAGKYRELLAEFIVESSSSFRIVEYASFHRFVSYLNGNAPLISRETVRKDTAELKNRFQRKLLDEVQSHLGVLSNGRVSLTIGPLRQAFIDFFYVSGYTAGFGQNRMSALRLEPVYKKKNNRQTFDEGGLRYFSVVSITAHNQ